MRPVAEMRMWCEPGQTYIWFAFTISPASASFTLSGQTSASCWLNCEVNVPGMCCTTKTAPGKLAGKFGKNFMRVAGPPVEAATITTGNRAVLFDDAGAGTTISAAFTTGL